jgi:hypothetical protein
MASSPEFKIYQAGEYVGCMKDLEDAARVCGMFGDGTQVRVGHDKRHTVWTEGSEEFSAAESFDRAAEVMFNRIEERASAIRGARAARFGEQA